MAKVFAETSSNPQTHTSSRSETREFFGGLSGPNVVESIRRKRYTLIVRDGFSRHTLVYRMRHKSDAAELSERFLVDTHADGVLFKVVVIRSDRGGEVYAGNFGDQSR